MLALLAALLLPSSTPAGVQDEKKKPSETAEIKQKDTGKVPSPKELEKDKKKQEQAKAVPAVQSAMAPVEAVVD